MPPVDPAVPPPQHLVAVRTLCEFTAKCGDLDMRFTTAPSAQEGIAGHIAVAARRGAGYQREVPLRGVYETLTVSGRADGYDAAAKRLEEVKTHRGAASRIPDNHRRLHWAQLKIYGALLCRKSGLPGIELALVYFELTRAEETVLAERCTAAELDAHFEAHCARYLEWARTEAVHRKRRDAYLEALPFPHPALRPGQRQLAKAVYRAARGNRSLLIQAPTGIGKTLGTLFPLLKAAPQAGLDKLFFLVAKTPGRRVALEALRGIGDGGTSLPLRVLEFTAKETACEYPGRVCGPDTCPLARGFYDRLAAARSAALEHGFLDRAAVRAVALQFAVCPYYLTHELARWCDVVVGDYHYYFDSSAALAALTSANQWRVGVLVDEAHNLPSRARAMYSATLGAAHAAAAERAAPAALRPLFVRFARAWRALAGVQRETYQAYPAIPASITAALQRLIAGLAEHLAAAPDAGPAAGPAAEPAHGPADETAPAEGGLLQFYFAALHFNRMAEAFGRHSLFDISLGPDEVLCVRNVIPAPFLAPRFAASATNVLFSATLAPPAFYRELLGLPADAAWTEIGAPFSADQLVVRVKRGISTRYLDRASSVDPIVAVIAGQYRLQPGNYLAFFSSFDYLRQVLARFRAHCPGIAAFAQEPRMRADAREEFLARFTAGNRGIGFAVLGGAFAEGIDLPGECLIGAFIATLGLPQINPVNAEFARRMHESFGTGYEYAYLYPGLQKVVQAAGRVIRTPSDRGTVYLMDDRFTRGDVRALLPKWWRVEHA